MSKNNWCEYFLDQWYFVYDVSWWKTETVWVDAIKESTLQYSPNATILFHVHAYILVVCTIPTPPVLSNGAASCSVRECLMSVFINI